MAAEETLFEELRAAVEAADAEMSKLYDSGAMDGFKDIPLDLRKKLLTMGASVNDYAFWVRRRRQDDDLSDDPETWMFYAEELEAGTGAWGVTAREALDNYFRDDILDHRRAG